MSCCIGLALCLLLLVAVMAGIAFGYNYSLSEFKFIKESHTPVAVKHEVQESSAIDYDNSLRKNSLTTNEITNNYDMYSDDHVENEKPLSTTFTRDLELDEIINQYPSGSVDQMKAILNHIYMKNLKKGSAIPKKKTTTTVQSLSRIISDKELLLVGQIERDNKLTTSEAEAEPFLNYDSSSQKSTATFQIINDTITL